MIQISRSFCDKAVFVIPGYIRNGQTKLSFVLMNNLSNMSTVDKPPLGAILVNPLKLPKLCEDNRIASDDVEMAEVKDTKVFTSPECTKQQSTSIDRNDNATESDSKQNIVLDIVSENNDLSGVKAVVKNNFGVPVSDEKIRPQQLQSTQDGCKQTVLPKNLLDSVTNLVRKRKIKLPYSETHILQNVKLADPEGQYKEKTSINVKENLSDDCDDLANDQPACMGIDTDHTAECRDTDNKDAVKEVVSAEISVQKQLHNILEGEETSAESTGVSTHEFLLENELLFPDLIEDFEKDDKMVQEVYDISPLFTGELDKRYKREKKRAFKRHKQNKQNIKQKKKGTKNKDGQEEEGEDNVEKKQTPNYFIAMQIKNKQIHDALHKVQEEVLAGNQLLSSAMIKLTKLHLTLMVLRLETDDDIARSKCALETAIEKLQCSHLNKALTVNLCGLGNFRNEIVFAKIKDKEQVDQLKAVVEVIEYSFMAQGLVSPDKHGFKPHITVMKLSKAKHLKKKGIKKIDEKLYKKYKSSEFGAEEVTEVQLCSMMKTDSTGYYVVEHQVPFVEGNTKVHVDDSGFDESIVETSDNRDLDKKPLDPSSDMKYCAESSDDSRITVRLGASCEHLDEMKNTEAENESDKIVDASNEIHDKVQDAKTGDSDIVEDDIIESQGTNNAVDNKVPLDKNCQSKDNDGIDKIND